MDPRSSLRKVVAKLRDFGHHGSRVARACLTRVRVGGAFFGSSGADFGAIQLEEAWYRLVVARSNYWSGLVPEFFARAFLISYKL